MAEFLFVNSRFGPHGNSLTHLGENHTDLSRGNLDPREFPHAVKDPELETDTWHEHLGLESRLTLEGDGIVTLEFREGEPFEHKPHLGGTNDMNGWQDENGQQQD